MHLRSICLATAVLLAPAPAVAAPPTLAEMVALTKKPTSDYVVVMEGWTRNGDEPPAPARFLEMRRGNAVRIEAPGSRVVADCATGKIVGFNTETGNFYNPGPVEMACGLYQGSAIDPNRKEPLDGGVELRSSRNGETFYIVTQVDRLIERRFLVSAHGIMLKQEWKAHGSGFRAREAYLHPAKLLLCSPQERYTQVTSLTAAATPECDGQGARTAYDLAAIPDMAFPEELSQEIDALIEAETGKILAGDDKAAAREANALVAQMAQRYGPSSPIFAEAVMRIGLVLFNDERKEASLPFFEQALRVGLEAMGPDHRDVAILMHTLADAHTETDRQKYKEKARTLLQQAVSARQKILGRTHPETVAAERALVRLEWETRGNSEASDLEALAGTLEHVIAASRFLYPAAYPDTLEAQLELAEIRTAQGKYDAAAALLNEAEQAMAEHGGFSAILLRQQAIEARIAWLKAQGRTDEAKALSEKSKSDMDGILKQLITEATGAVDAAASQQ